MKRRARLVLHLFAVSPIFWAFTISSAALTSSSAALTSALSSSASGSQFTECEAAMAANPKDFASAKCFYSVAFKTSLWAEARAVLHTHFAAHPELPWLGFYIASIAEQQGDEYAVTLFQTSAELFASVGDASGETYSYKNAARLLEQLRKPEQALEAAQKAKAAAEASGIPVLLLEVRMLELRLRYVRGEELVGIQRGLRKLESALDEDASYTLRKDVLMYLATTSFDLGEDDDALGYFEEASALTSAAGDVRAVAAIQLSTLRTVLARQADEGWKTEAEVRARTALEAARAAGVPGIEVEALLTLGRLVDGAAGRELVEQSLALARRVGNSARERDALARLALMEIHDSARALELAEESLRVARLISDPLSFAWPWYEQAEVRWRVEGREAALQYGEELFAVLEKKSRAETSDSGRARLFSVWSEAYYWFVGKLFQDYFDSGDWWSLERAFEVQERMRARLLAPAQEVLGSEAPLMNLTDLEETLDDEEALLSFQMKRDRDGWGLFAGGAWLLVSTRDGTRLFPISSLGEMEPRISMLLALLERRDGSEKIAAEALYRDLVGKAIAGLPSRIKRIVLIPDGPLHLVPFAGLLDLGGRPLGTRFELVQIPSIRLWKRLRERATPEFHQGVVAVVDPRNSVSEAGGDSEVASDFHSWEDTEMSDLAPLRFARREGGSLQRAFGASCQILKGRDASEFRVLQELPGSRLVHFATHALVDSRSPERSAIVLARTVENDGLLESPEIANLQLDGGLVVLSTCDSAAGPLLRGEGVMSLSRSFFRGGARTLVASLWRLRDREASEFFDVFYRNLSQATSVSEALSAAQRDRFEAGAPLKAWAGLTVLGDGAWVPFPNGTHAQKMGLGVLGTAAARAVAVVFLVVALAFLLMRRGRR